VLAPGKRSASRKSEVTAAIRYAFSRWRALLRCIDDGRIEIDNNNAERALRAVVLGRNNYLFAGSDSGGNGSKYCLPDRVHTIRLLRIELRSERCGP
jgi:hypothetical protein